TRLYAFLAYSTKFRRAVFRVLFEQCSWSVLWGSFRRAAESRDHLAQVGTERNYCLKMSAGLHCLIHFYDVRFLKERVIHKTHDRVVQHKQCSAKFSYVGDRIG